MIGYKEVKGDEVQFQSLVSMSVLEFEWLHNLYAVEWEHHISRYTLSGEQRIRAHRIRKDSQLPTTEDQLLFILHYLKAAPLQQHHAVAYGMTQPLVNLWVHLLLKLIRRALQKDGHLPQRRSSTINALLQKVEEVRIDGTERRIQRPADYEEQQDHYSGKKKTIR